MKGQCTISKILFPLVLSTFIEQNIFFPETYNAFTISEPDFTECIVLEILDLWPQNPPAGQLNQIALDWAKSAKQPSWCMAII